jgi:hypothetical protein
LDSKAIIETFAKYQYQERALKAAAVAARIDEADLFQPQRVVNSEAEYTKWMKQQPTARETDILK